MREIKYRVWHREAKKMLETYVIDQTLHYGDTVLPIYHMTCRGYVKGTNEQFVFAYDEVEWLQYTGLKDRLLKEMFEGDIISIYGKSRHVVEWDNISARFLLRPTTAIPGKHTAMGKAVQSGKVIGNIYSNPELLKPNDLQEVA